MDAFDTPCDIEAVSAIPEGDWFEDTSVPDAPDPIRDCPAVAFGPLPVPPECPDLAQAVDATLRTVAAGQEYLRLTVSQAPGCAFDFALDGALPVECPTFPEAPARAEVVPSTWPGYLLAMLRPVGKVVPAAAGSGSYSDSVSAADACAFSFGFELGMPCVKAAGRYPGHVRGVAPGDAFAEVTVAERASCSLDFSLDLGWPSFCTELVTSDEVDASYVPPGRERLALRFGKAASGCSWSLDVEAHLPRPGGLIGRVVSGSGRDWGLRLYPDGLENEVTAFDADVAVPNATPYEMPPIGAVVTPVNNLGAWGESGPFLYALASFLELEIGVSGPFGIGARVGLTPGSANDVQFFQFDGTSLIPASSGEPGGSEWVFNAFGANIRPNRLIVIAKVGGYRFVVAEDCSGVAV
jgi:hypothetical protein